MSPLAACRAGLRRVLRAPALLLLLWCGSAAIAVPPALAMHDAISTHLGESLEADRVVSGVNHDWMREFREQATPLGQTLRADVIGFAAVMDNTSALADMSGRAPVVVIAGVIYVLLLWFLTPGLIHRLAADRPIGAQVFLGRCGASAMRLLRLNLVATVIYAVLFASVHPWLFDQVFDTLTHDVTVERTAFLTRLGFYVAFFAVVAAVNLIVDFAKVRMVVEDRHSVLSSINAAMRFVGGHTGLAFGVYFLNVGLLLAVVACYFVVAPGAGTTGWTMWAGFAVSQMYIGARVLMKLAFWASEAAALQAAYGCPGLVRS